MSIKSVMLSTHLILCHPLLLLPPIPPSIRLFPNESTLRMRWPKYSFSIIPSKEIPGLISFGMDWLDFLAVQGTFKSLLQHRSSKASVPWHTAFFTVQFSHPYTTTSKTPEIVINILPVSSQFHNPRMSFWSTLSPRFQMKTLRKVVLLFLSFCGSVGA